MKDTVILITRAGLGHTSAGDESFGMEMLDLFLHTLEKRPENTGTICFYTEGVKLLVPDSPVAMGLKMLQRLGVRLVACQTCLDHYDVGTDLVAGERATMADIVELVGNAEKVISV